MTDTSTPDFERRFADALERYAATARDPRPAVLVATRAMAAPRPRRLRLVVDRRTPLLALAAMLLLAAALAGVGARLAGPASGARLPWSAVTTRPNADGVDILLVAADGEERVLRHLVAADVGLPPDVRFESGGTVSERGWMALYTQNTSSTWTDDTLVLIDLADPARAPLVLASNGFTGVRWGPDGEVGWVCGDCGANDLGDPQTALTFDPDEGLDGMVRTSPVRLHGGGPELIWAADGSGFLAGSGAGWGVTPLGGGPVVPGFPRVLSRWVGVDGFLERSGPTIAIRDTDGRTTPWYRGELAPAVLEDAVLAADGRAVWLLLTDRSVTPPTVVLARMGAPGGAEVQATAWLPGDLGPGGSGPGTAADVAWTALRLSPDDRVAAITWTTADERWRSSLLPADGGGAPVETSAFDGLVLGLVPADAARSWPGT